jgi:hypothetical protein
LINARAFLRDGTDHAAAGGKSSGLPHDTLIFDRFYWGIFPQ